MQMYFSLLSTKMRKHKGLIGYHRSRSSFFLSFKCSGDKRQNRCWNNISLLLSCPVSREKKCRQTVLKEWRYSGWKNDGEDTAGEIKNSLTWTRSLHPALRYGTRRSRGLAADVQHRASGLRWSLHPLAASPPQRKLHLPLSEAGKPVQVSSHCSTEYFFSM